MRCCSVGGAGAAAAAAQTAGMAKVEAGGAARLNCLTSMAVVVGLPGGVITALMMSPVLGSCQTLITPSGLVASTTLVTMPLTVTGPERLMVCLGSGAIMAADMTKGSPQSPVKVAAPQPPEVSMRSQVYWVWALRS